MRKKETTPRNEAAPRNDSIRRLNPDEERKLSGAGVFLSIVSFVSYIAMISVTFYKIARSRNSSGRTDLSDDPENRMRIEWSNKNNKEEGQEDLEDLARNIREHNAFIGEFYDN